MTSSNTPLSTLVRLIDGISEWSGRAISWLTLTMVLATFTIVVMRYLFNTGNVALQESVIYMHSFVFLLGAAYTLKHDGHVRVDIFYRPMGEKGKAIINLFGTVCLLLPVTGFIFYISWEYVATSWELTEGSQEAGGIPFRYILKTSLLLMPAMMMLQGIGEILRSILVLTGQGHLLEEEEGHAL
ncbi:TRAP transporter small permease subunit [Pontibacterium sp. N1Y112]|uniref:TRAP transporter small permease protein n=1 Tax=Pontibacterium sinense TaxID=2781979 RepID=A0A8J7FHX8_9GAMM|nr:TRAP transporter small permease subunit [Pontibacterium sinense]MBE9399591.1 TRAP transporter small permease subunit [Pontibacterium sinense]